MAKIIAKEFSKRNDIEAFIRAEFGTNMIENEVHVIEGTRAELKILHLSDTSRIYGIKCVITDTSTKKLLADKHKQNGKKHK